MVKRKMKTKNVKIKNVLAIVAIITIMLLTFVACDSPQTTEPNFQQFEIKFYLNESDETPYATLKVDKKDFDFESYLPAEPSKPSTEAGRYEFLGWFYSDGSIFDFNKIAKNEDVNVYAKFSFVNNSFTVMFQDDDGTPIKVNGKTTQEVNYGDAAIEPKKPTKEGYTFAGWDKDFTNITENVTIKATYTVNEYTITYKSLGEVISTSKAQFGASISDTTPEISEKGLTFVGFFDENGEQKTNMQARDITLVAKWKIQEISKIELTQNVDRVVYGDALPEYTLKFEKVKNSKITYKVEWLINGEKVEGEVNTYVPQNKNAGKYDVKAKIIASVEGLESVEAYSSSLAYYVNKATLTINVSSATIIYGDDLPRFTYTIEGYKYGENESVLAGAFSVKTDYKKGLGVGNYIVSGDGLLASNYELRYNSATLTVVGRKTQIEIVSGDYEINYGEQLTVEVTYKKDGEPFNYDGLSVTPSRTTFDVGSTYIVTLTLDKNDYYDATEKEVVVKVKSVSYNGVLYTIEDALKLNTAKTGTATVNDYLIITANTSFATSEVKAKRPDVYFGEQYYTLSKNEYLLVPFSSAHEIKADIVEQAIAGTSKNSAYVTLTLPSGTSVESYGHILVNAVRAGGAGVSGNPSGNKYGAIQIRDNATLTINGGVFETLGFVHGQGKVVVKSGNVYETMSLLNFKGGSVTFKIYKDIFPVNQFTLSNIMVDMEICQGVNYFAKAYIYARMEVQSDVKFIGSTKEEFIQLKSGKIIKTFDETMGKMTLNMYGNIQLNDMAISMPGIFGQIEVSTNGKQVPLSGYVDIVAKTGSIIDIGVGIKLLPGAEFTIEKGATVNLNKGGNLFVYSNDENMKLDKSTNPKNTPVFEGFQDGQWQYPVTSQDAWFNNITVTFTSKTPAVIIVEGTLNVKSGSAIAGTLTAKEGGNVIVEDGANLTHSIKEDFTLSSGLGTTKNFFTSTSSASGLIGGVLTKFEVGTYTGTKEGWVKG